MRLNGRETNLYLCYRIARPTPAQFGQYEGEKEEHYDDCHAHAGRQDEEGGGHQVLYSTTTII